MVACGDLWWLVVTCGGLRVIRACSNFYRKSLSTCWNFFQWSQVEVGNEIAMHFLLTFVSSLDSKPLFVPIEANLGLFFTIVTKVTLKCLFFTKDL